MKVFDVALILLFVTSNSDAELIVWDGDKMQLLISSRTALATSIASDDCLLE